MLEYNYPNPFNSTTFIYYHLPADSEIEGVDFNALGKRVRTLVKGFQIAGTYSTVWQAKNERGQDVSSGLCYYRLYANNEIKQSQKMVLLR